LKYESILWEYVGKMLSQVSEKPQFQMPRIRLEDLANLPVEAQKIIGDAIKQRDEEEKGG
jgi:hypothetical protein